MNGFDSESWTCNHARQVKMPHEVSAVQLRTAHRDGALIFRMGKQYVLADEMYASNFDASSYVSHQYIIAGQRNRTNQLSAGELGLPGRQERHGPQIKKDRHALRRPQSLTVSSYKTLGDELDDAGDTWAFYARSVEGSSGASAVRRAACGAQDGTAERGIWSSVPSDQTHLLPAATGRKA